MTNEVTNYQSQVPVAYDADVFSAIENSAFTARLQLITSKSKYGSDGTIPLNHYAYVSGGVPQDVGATVDAWVYDVRPMAMDNSGNFPIFVHDPKVVEGKATGEFKRIMEQSTVSDSGCSYGLEFLMYIPVKKGFATFFMGSKSSRQLSPFVKEHLNKPITLSSKKVEHPKYPYFTPHATECSTTFELPSEKAVIEEVTKFRTPKDTVVETVNDGKDNTRER